jgi:phospholipid:diacylglycerol acyltransferase
MTADVAGAWILEHTPSHFQVSLPSAYLVLSRRHCANKPDELQKMMATNYSFGIERDEKALKRNDFDHRKWTNPLEHRYANHIYGQIVPHPTHIPDYPMLLL